MCVCFVNYSVVASDKFLELVIRFTQCTLVEIVVHVRYLAVLESVEKLDMITRAKGGRKGRFVVIELFDRLLHIFYTTGLYIWV